jgi:hypothetical protein
MANAELVTRPIHGEARRVQLRSAGGGGSYDILTFVVDRFDEMGDRLTPIPVEMKGTIQGVLNDGDKVEIDIQWQPGQTLAPTKFLNKTTGGIVQTQGSTIMGYILGAIVIAIFIAMVIWGLTFVAHH